MAIKGETYEFTTMYPEFHKEAIKDGNTIAAGIAIEQITESKEHAEQFAQILNKAEKRFAALTKIEKRHAEAYTKIKESL